ncbi:MAG: HmuY family protein [Balneola sp.]
MNSLNNKLTLLVTVLAFGFFACEDSGSNGPAPVEGQMAEDIPANVNTMSEFTASDVQDNPDNKENYTFFDFETGATVSDSLSADWDIAFSSTTILANSGNDGGIQLVETAYDDVDTAPTTGFEANNSSWYTYTGEAPSGPKHAILPNEDETLIIKTSAGKYAKVRMISYYEGDPDTESDEFENMQTRPASQYFTFEYALQNAESTQLYHEDSFTYYDLETGELVSDSSSSQWDIGLNATTIIANTENGGGIQSLNIAYSDLDEAPTSSYEESVTDWYLYTGEAPTGPKHAILPKDNLTLVLKTASDIYAKVRIISYYKGNPDTSSEDFINFIRPESRYYTFEYAVQTDGSTNFE